MKKWVLERLNEKAPCKVEPSMRCIPLMADPICYACFEEANKPIKRINTMSKKISDLNPFVAGLCRRLISLCKAEGITLRVTSTLRTEAEQVALFAQGRNSLKYVNDLRASAGLPPITESENKIVTHSLTSVHQFGYAFDTVVIKDGVPSWRASDYKRVGEIAESLGLEWGGRWRFKDYCHFQYTGGLTIAEIKAGKRPEPITAGVRG